MEFKEIKSLYRQSLKSMDTEEHIDLFSTVRWDSLGRGCLPSWVLRPMW